MEISGKRIKRILSLAILTLLTISQPFPALAARSRRGTNSSKLTNKRAKAIFVKRQVESLSSQLNRVVQQHQVTLNRLRVIDYALRENQTKLEEAQRELEKNQQIFNGRVNTIYRYGRLSFINVLLGTEDYREFVQRYDLLKKIGRQDREVLEAVKRNKAEIEKRQQELTRGKALAKYLLKKIRSQRASIEGNLRRQQSLLAGIEREVAALAQAESRLRQVALARQPVSRSSINFRAGNSNFPVAGPHSYTDSFGDPRRGHRHQGIDIFALRGTPVIASASGSVEATWTSGGGKTIYLRGDDGTTYVYMHLDGYAVTGGRVSAGQVIGYVGDTGNAKGGSPHLHYEVRPGGGRAIDPYPILSGSE